jgi:hypothetical protein
MHDSGLFMAFENSLPVSKKRRGFFDSGGDSMGDLLLERSRKQDDGTGKGVARGDAVQDCIFTTDWPEWLTMGRLPISANVQQYNARLGFGELI